MSVCQSRVGVGSAGTFRLTEALSLYGLQVFLAVVLIGACGCSPTETTPSAEVPQEGGQVVAEAAREIVPEVQVAKVDAVPANGAGERHPEPLRAFPPPSADRVEAAIAQIWIVFGVAVVGFILIFIGAALFNQRPSWSESSRPTEVIRAPGYQPKPRGGSDSERVRYDLDED